jgi:hypothetical protein
MLEEKLIIVGKAVKNIPDNHLSNQRVRWGRKYRRRLRTTYCSSPCNDKARNLELPHDVGSHKR